MAAMMQTGMSVQAYGLKEHLGFMQLIGSFTTFQQSGILKITTKKFANACNENHRAFVPPTFANFEQTRISATPSISNENRKTVTDA